ncbi:MAG: phosphoribosylformylglycinamidine synthase subunit PurL [Chloroflexi bacterium]|nr:phosphoribosylformylglycinamidine synthase subunit PurL [Chloroflexota bacterium]
MPATREMLDEVALTPEEYELIVAKLGREPNHVELGMFGAMWSEHCGYKNSRPVLRLLPTKGPRVLQGPGENAGAVDIGDGLAVVLKIESHNHPSAVEPYQGAATGVGGIVRDIFTMGARPIALLDSLRFGSPAERRNQYLVSGVVGGIAGYGNCLGVPTVAGEVYFEDSYSGNPLVNAMCVGLVRADQIVRATASGAGNPVILVGADTGRDGIHGATFASVELNERSEERRPAVQVGNPFLEKLLIEACLELLQTDYVVGMQDLGAAGLTSSAVEMASRGGCGIDIDLLKVSRREKGMTPYELMLSESQERMLVVARRGCEGKVQRLFARWGLHSDLIGAVTDDGLVRVREGERVVAEIPARLLTDETPVYHRDGVRPAWIEEAHRFDPSSLPLKGEYSRTLLDLLASPNLCSRKSVFQQYDHMVQTNTMLLPGEGDAAVLRVKGTRKGISLTTDGNGRYCHLEPRWGGMIAVAEAARNLVCTGAEPLAVTDCLNYGNPEKPEVFYTFRESVAGIAEACEFLGVPVVSGNVSLYNENNGSAIYPTPVVGMVGLLEDVAHATGLAFREPGDLVVLLGRNLDDLGGTEYLKLSTGRVAGTPPRIDLGAEARVQRCCLAAIRAGLVRSAHDCADGGLAVALAEGCMAGDLGMECEAESLEALLRRDGCRPDALLFGESQSRIILSMAREKLPELERLAAENGVPLAVLGTVAGRGGGEPGRRGDEARLRLGDLVDLPVSQMREVWSNALDRMLSE